MALRQLSHRNHINDWCTEYAGAEILGRYCSMSTRNLGFRGDSVYFRNYNIDVNIYSLSVVVQQESLFGSET